MGADPVAQPLCPGGLGVGVAAGAEYGNEQLGLADLAGDGIPHRDGLARVVDKQLLAGPVFLAQHHVLLPTPALVELAEAAVTVAVRVHGAVLLPEQLQGEVLVLPQLGVDRGKVGRRPVVLFGPGWSFRRQGRTQAGLIPVGYLGPPEPGCFGGFQILRDRALADEATSGNFALREPE